MKKFLSVIISFALLLSMMPATVFAVDASVAEVNGTQYGTLLEAINAAQAGQTITLLENCTIDAGGYTDENYAEATVTLPAGVTLDLNGKTLTIPYQKTLFAGENITIKNGTITTGTLNQYVLYLMSGSFTVENVVCTNGINVQTAEVTLKDVEVTNPNSKYYAVYSAGNVTILSGTFKNTSKTHNTLYGNITVKGGTFSKDPSAFVAEGYVVQNNDDSTYTVIVDTYVAEVGGNKYATLLEAINAAQAGQTITLLENCTIDAGGYTDENYAEATVTLPAGVTLDLNGKTLTIPYQKTLFAGENITIKNGTITTGTLNQYVLYLMSGSFTVEDVVCTNGINVQTAEVTLKNVTATNPNSKYYAVYSAGNVTILSGTFKNTSKTHNTLYGNITVKGGTFSKDPSKFVAEGYVVQDNDDGTYTVVVDTYVAEVGGNKYETLQDAVNAAQAGQTITLLKDCELAVTVAMPDGVTLDLNGKTLVVHYAVLITGKDICITNGTLAAPTGKTQDYVLFVGDMSSVTVKDIVAKGGINIQNNATAVLENVTATAPRKYYAVYAGENTNVTIKSGNYDGGTKKIDLYAAAGASFTLYGGTYTNKPHDEYLAEGYWYIENDNGTHTVQVNAVAAIGGVGYGSLQAAIEAAQAGDTITVLKNITERNVTVAAGKRVIIDLNGKTVDVDIMNYGVLTVKNGTINNTNSGASAIENNGADAELTVENLNITSVRHALRIDGGKATIVSGTYVTIGQATVFAVNISTGATVEIVDGTFKGAKETGTNEATAAVKIRENSTVTIANGNFSGGILGTLQCDETSTISITGGIFDEDPTAYVAEGYAAIINNLRTLWTVKEIADRNIVITTTKTECITGDIVQVHVWIYGTGIVSADWTLTYDTNIFEFVNPDDKAEVTLVEETMTGFRSDVPVYTYTFRVLRQENESVETSFQILNAVTCTIADSLAGVDVQTEATPANVTVKHAVFDVTVMVDGAVNTEGKADFEYENKEHTVEISAVPNATIKLTVNGEPVEAADLKFTAAGTYVIAYEISKENYETVTGTFTLTIEVPEYLVKAGANDYVFGKMAIVLVYTNSAHISFTYDGATMYDVTAKYPMEGYAYTYALVIRAMPNAEKVEVVYSPVDKTYVYNQPDNVYDMNGNGRIDLGDVTLAYGVYAANEEIIQYMIVVFNADLDGNMIVDSDEFGEVMAAYNARSTGNG